MCGELEIEKKTKKVKRHLKKNGQRKKRMKNLILPKKYIVSGKN